MSSNRDIAFSWLLNEASRDDITDFYGVAKRRIDHLSFMNHVQLKPGDRVRTCFLRPGYINNLTGVISEYHGRDKQNFVVRLDRPITRGGSRYGQTSLIVSAGCVKPI